MELQGRVIAVLPERSGTSARGEWKSQSFVIETHEQYPRKMVFDVFGADRLAQFNIKGGEEITVSFNNIRAWNVQHIDPAAAQAGATGPQPMAGGAPFGAPAEGAQAPFPPAPAAGDGDSADDLPF